MHKFYLKLDQLRHKNRSTNIQFDCMCLLCSTIYLDFFFYFFFFLLIRVNARHLVGVVFISTAIVDSSFLQSGLFPRYYDCTAGQAGRLQDRVCDMRPQERKRRIWLAGHQQSVTPEWIVNGNRSQDSQQKAISELQWVLSVYSAWAWFGCDRGRQALWEPTKVELLSENSYWSPCWVYSSLYIFPLVILLLFPFIYQSLSMSVSQKKQEMKDVWGLQSALGYREMKNNYK